ncbi:nucleotide disphospho-sugar-binding domain-containing protein [Streptomyces sparsogenes]|uniref:Protein IroB n=1 Tax=Streptomyces sparsogenes DSM 40356 TaxID=1331668 RepID=A0A1R1S6Z3_9ACTN|nr:nucleotide disphospho-sugar-binding domain-containing protein [Streptomyces sparsogenes]OMI33972.1 protein IroB [Streptomyces sparsogenes DSM 40356]
MRVLMTTTPSPSHLAPMIPLAWALRAAGHDVLVMGQPDIQRTAHSAGLNSVSVGAPYHGNDSVLPYLPPGVRPLQVLGRNNREVLPGAAKVYATHARYMIHAYLEVARAWRPDLVVGEQFDYTSLMIGGALGVPAVHHRWGVDPLTGPARPIAAIFLDGLCRRLGMDGLPEPHAVLDPCPPALQAPDAAPGTPIRFVPFNGAGTRPDWVTERPAARRVCVTLGRQTLVTNGLPLLRHVIEAFDGLRDEGGAEVEAVVTVDSRFRDQVGTVPPAVRLVDPTPLNLFLHTCDAVVHHGGCGSAMTATAAGLPQLVLPQLLDQFTVGDALADAGAGIGLDTAAAQDDPEQVRAAVTALLTDEAYRSAADRLAEAVRDMPSPARVASDLEQLVATGQSPAGAPALAAAS